MVMKSIIGMFALLICAFATAQVAEQSPQEIHFDHRVSMLQGMVEGAGYGKTVLLGDSIAEGFFWNSTTCGALINAGSGRANTEMLHARVARIFDITRPSVGVVPIGINDAHAWTDMNDWRWRYNGIAYLMFQRGITPVFETPLPVEYGKPLGSEYFDQATLLQIVAHIRAVARNYGAVLNDQFAAFADGSGYLPAGSTFDGVHPRGALYRAIYTQRQGAIRRAWAKRGISC
jgi:lysophospholipase L1-like esterase